jgi:glucose-6-phosphate 1-dehydrogenase
MAKIRPSVAAEDIICVDLAAPPAAIVVFGASGDLTQRKLLPSLFELHRRDLLSEHFYLLGCGRKGFSDEQFRRIAEAAIDTDATQKQIESFLSRLYYISGNYDDHSFYSSLGTTLAELDRKYGVDASHVFYLSVPPFLYGPIVARLHSAGLSCPAPGDASRKARLVVEKPFGRDLESAAQLNRVIAKCFEECQIYRIDHYLGKETVQNILIFRFANMIFEPVWNRNYIDSVQITIAEGIGVEHRASYYEKSGALRDMFQNHMLQMLALVAMEPPVSFEADRLRDEKVKLLRSIRPFDPARLDKLVVRGQYGPGRINGNKVIGYRDEAGVDPESKTETFVAAKVFVDNWRWKGVPFYLRTGKRLAKKDTEVAITFKTIPHSMFIAAGLGVEQMPPNVLVLQIQPEEGISLGFQAKRPGTKICMSTLNMEFHYQDIFAVHMPGAYQRLLLDCMIGDQTLFTRYDSVDVAWNLLTPVLEAWENSNTRPIEYPAGSQGFAEADRLVESDGRKWRSLKPMQSP